MTQGHGAERWRQASFGAVEIAMVSLLLAYGSHGSPLAVGERVESDGATTGFYFCPACEVYGRGTSCWWCHGRELQWTYAPSGRGLPTRIDARSMTSSWRTPNDLERWLRRDDSS
jgi:hypothetical protein